jgi:predicted small secreted protein
MKKKLVITAAAMAVLFVLAGCESWDRTVKDIGSGVHGLNRTATVYDQAGNTIKTYKGRFDVEVNEYGNKVKFDLDGKRVLIYNATVIVEEE